MTLWISACKSYSEQQQKKSIKRLHASWILVNPFPYIYTLETAVFSKAIHFPPLQCNGCSGVNLGFPWCIWSGQCCCFIFLFIWVETQFCGCGWICFQGRKWTLSAPFESWHLAGTQWDFCRQFESQMHFSTHQINHTSLTRRRDAYRVQTSSEATVCLTSPDFNSTRDETKCLDVCQLLLICMCTLCYITIR